MNLVHDGVTMASELAANTLHAQGNVEFSGIQPAARERLPRLWLYLRGRLARSELVCKVFDSQPGWKTGSLPDVKVRVPARAETAGDCRSCDGLSAGEWGAHLTRGRLGSWKVSGKAVWFALRYRRAARWTGSAGPSPARWQAVNALEAMLADRGLGPPGPGRRAGPPHVGAVHQP